MNSNPGIAAVPLQAIAPNKKMAKKWETKTKSSNHNNHPFIPEILKSKLFETKPSNQNKPNKQTKLRANVEKKDPNFVPNEASFDISGVPPPFCSCSGYPRRCYKSGPGGWQSSCCTNSLSEYPLPLSPCKPRKRVSGRKMTGGAYKKLLCGLAKDGRDLSHPIDLKDHWAKIGTNKFVTIK